MTEILKVVNKMFYIGMANSNFFDEHDNISKLKILFYHKINNSKSNMKIHVDNFVSSFDDGGKRKQRSSFLEANWNCQFWAQALWNPRCAWGLHQGSELP